MSKRSITITVVLKNGAKRETIVKTGEWDKEMTLRKAAKFLMSSVLEELSDGSTVANQHD